MVSRNLKILIISKQFPPNIGGGGAHAEYLANALAERGHKVIVLTSTSKKHKTIDKTPKDSNPAIYRKDFDSTKTLHYESPIERGLRICEDTAPDIIHGQHLAGAFIGLHLKASFGIPLVVTIHKTPLSQWDETKPKQHSTYSFLKLLSQLESIDLFIAGSEAFKQELLNIGVKAKKIKRIYHGIPVETFRGDGHKEHIMTPIITRLDFKPNKHFKIDGELEGDLFRKKISEKFIQTFATNGFSLEKNLQIIRENNNGWTIVDDDIFIVKKEDEKLNIHPVNIIFCPSRIDERRKNLDVFVKACGLLHQQINDRNFIFLITGKAENQFEERYQRQLEGIADDMGIKENLKFISFTRWELPVVYRLAKVCVLPSLREGLGLTLVEALALRTPIIGTNVIGIKEVIESNGKYGLFFDIGDFEHLGKQLLNLVCNNKLREKLKHDGYKRAEENFNAKWMAMNHIECYKHLIEKKGLRDNKSRLPKF
ncbi:MAG: glycosyltransferase family 4 protein [Euryarchaeota archaeon]|nr:glycosyltransferase family 4 protein [Euryarchaeota archaeon]